MSILIETITKAKTGDFTRVIPDWFIITENNGEAIIKAMENRNMANAEKVLIMFDRDVPASTIESAEIQKKLACFAAKHRTHFANAEGVAYNVLIEKYLSPGEIVLSTGSHCSIVGADEAWGIQADVGQFVDALEQGYIDVKVPETVQIELTNTLSDGVEVKDLALTLLKDSGESGFEDKSIEFYGDGLTQAEKTVLCSMAGQTGASAVFYRSEQTASSPAAYTYDLATIETKVAKPGSIFNVDGLKSVEGQPINAGFIGSCTGGSIEDLRVAAKILEGKQVHLRVRLNVCPQTAETYMQAMQEGLIDIFIDGGAQILTPGCGSCQRNTVGGVGPGEVMLTTGAYNYTGCCGVEDSEVYMSSVSTVVLSAIEGKITHAENYSGLTLEV
ncbi:aconitase family protein [Sporosarcina sp. ACRSM]|uniref:aconitase family protein n=1 Tax=Sporosarcina sp. ACRSM TaxID=2918216 RepID=UPI001EF6E729|nr:aconitase family protein [Sporosarcina sp. ACRSM]MCG7335050.1 aconitase family protein [Sporosarcina sp. ACRSM]